MEHPYLPGIPYLISIALVMLVPVFVNVLSAQVPPDSIPRLHKKVNITDTVRSLSDSSIKSVRQQFQHKKQQLKQDLHAKPPGLSALKGKIPSPTLASLGIDSIPSLKGMLFGPPILRLTNGYVNYNFNYRSNIDTPYAEKNIQQHHVQGQFNALIAGSLPIQVNYWLRQTNSQIFKDIADVQVSFNGPAFRNHLQSVMRKKWLEAAAGYKDSLLEQALLLKEQQLQTIRGTLNNKFHPQKITEAGEILHVPHITYDMQLPDSVNKQRETTAKKDATLFLDEYKRTKQLYDSVHRQVDSLQGLADHNRKKLQQFRDMVNGGWEEAGAGRLKKEAQQYGMQAMPGWYRWLMGIRNFSVGRSAANYSELTAKNVSVNGINFEYNSWYYLALMAGSVNYRFRDFVVNGTKKVPQYVVLARAGLGSLERNFFILSAWRGQKQLYGSSTSGYPAITITGFSMEGKWALNRSSWLKAEVAQSMSPDIRSNPVEYTSKFNLRDRNSQAVALQLYSYIPLTGTRVEGLYKKTGANYQSFNSYQSNTEQQSWYVKAEQSLFSRRLRIAGALRSNEYTNPLIVQNYKSNTIFKSVSASLRIPKWPMVTVGYQPMSQYTKAGNDILENRFQTFNATLYHGYTWKQLSMSTTAMLNKFYNNNNDTAFAYYNATNTYLMQSFFFPAFTANIGASLTKNAGYELQVLDGYIEPVAGKWGTVGAGIKLNNMNHTIIKTGGYVNASIRIGKQDMLFISYEHGFLPSVTNTLVRSEMGTINYTRTFNFK
jgi:hypothetical protein